MKSDLFWGNFRAEGASVLPARAFESGGKERRGATRIKHLTQLLGGLLVATSELLGRLLGGLLGAY